MHACSHARMGERMQGSRGRTAEQWNGGTVERWNGGTVERWNGERAKGRKGGSVSCLDNFAFDVIGRSVKPQPASASIDPCLIVVFTYTFCTCDGRAVKLVIETSSNEVVVFVGHGYHR